MEMLPTNVSATTQPPITPSQTSKNGLLPVTPSMFGVNVSGWDPWMLTSSGVKAIQSMGFGVQQFPNCPWIYNWSTNKSLNNGSWYPIPVSLNQWATELQQTHNKGLYIVPYGFNRTGTGGATVGTVTRLTKYIVQHHEPVSAMVIGSEQYGGWAQNIHHQRTAQRYAQLSAQMAQAIHKIDPSMQVGIDYALPANVTQSNSASTMWNRTVLSVAGPYVQFVSVHIYPLNQVQGDVSLLQSLHNELALDMNYVSQQIHQYAGTAANHLSIWITEFNPYGLESAQSVKPVFGSALIQSYLQMMSEGAKQVDWWAMYGDAHVPQPPGSVAYNTPLATGNNAPFASNGLASEGIAPQPQPVNGLYPTGTAYQAMMQLVGRRATLQIDPSLYSKYHVFAAAIHHKTFEDWVVINDSHQTTTVTVAGQKKKIPSSGMYIFKNVPLNSTYASSVNTLSIAKSPTPTSPTVLGAKVHRSISISSAVWNPMTQVLTITGTGLKGSGASIPAPGTGIDQTSLMVSDLTTKANYGWAYKGVNTDWYGISPIEWTNSSVALRLDGPMPQSSDNLQVTLWKTIGFTDVPVKQSAVHMIAAPLNEATTGKITSASYSPSIQTLTINGRNLGTLPATVPAHAGGTLQEKLSVLVVGSNIQYGYQRNNDWYGLFIKSWTPTTIVVHLSQPPAQGQPLKITWQGTGQTVEAIP